MLNSSIKFASFLVAELLSGVDACFPVPRVVILTSKRPFSEVPTNAKSVQGALFGKGEDDILNEQTKAAVYFESIAGAINNAIYQRSPYSWK